MFPRALAVVFLASLSSVPAREKGSRICLVGEGSIHEFSDRDVKGKPLNFQYFSDNILLIVNVATYCQFTYQYYGLNKLQEKYGSRRDEERCGLKILGVPCNQFAHQEPGNNPDEIFNGLKYVRPGHGFEPQFRLVEKRDVNGANEHSLYTWLKERCPSASSQINELSSIYYTPVRNNDISWNFEKILVDHKGQPWKRYTSPVEPEELVADIESLIDVCRS